jgi:predicted ATP-grasp superfamily ATP-dependent carboligase
VSRPELFEPTIRLLEAMQFTGIAEVEYKWDSVRREFKLIEVNPRPWDQHRLGSAVGVDLIHLAYFDHAGLPRPQVTRGFSRRKWIAEDAFLFEVLRLVWRRERGLRALLREARGPKVYAIWLAKDPLPFIAYAGMLVPRLLGLAVQAIARRAATLFSRGKAPARAIP